MINYFKKVGSALEHNLLNWQNLIVTAVIVFVILGISALTGGIGLVTALSIFIPYTIEVFLMTSIFYSLFCYKSSEWSVKENDITE